MLQTVEVFHCTNTDRHENAVWVRMKVGQFEPDRRVTLYCPTCKSSIAIDYTRLQGYILTSEAE